ncbi:hypothetical protein [Deinococcus ruber]|uniref:hypothetical protein n=1 Tax=Deinococcus ruber TaxID=1848197 RepID=UPI0016638F09|nr:hypothetical protein [Deinococcus ruber]
MQYLTPTVGLFADYAQLHRGGSGPDGHALLLFGAVRQGVEDGFEVRLVDADAAAFGLGGGHASAVAVGAIDVGLLASTVRASAQVRGAHSATP